MVDGDKRRDEQARPDEDGLNQTGTGDDTASGAGYGNNAEEAAEGSDEEAKPASSD